MFGSLQVQPRSSSHPSRIFQQAPKQVVRASQDYTAKSVGELTCNQGDFFYVINEVNRYFEVTNPILKVRGLLPQDILENLDKKTKTRDSGVDTGAPITGKLSTYERTKIGTGEKPNCKIKFQIPREVHKPCASFNNLRQSCSRPVKTRWTLLLHDKPPSIGWCKFNTVPNIRRFLCLTTVAIEPLSH